jgi:hypothetical protein
MNYSWLTILERNDVTIDRIIGTISKIVARKRVVLATISASASKRIAATAMRKKKTRKRLKLTPRRV